MYWYLSFLRPPPVSAPAGSSITITPQIANDLRTELYSQPISIYYTFAQSHPKWQKAQDGQLLTKWDVARSQYAPVTIPIPEGAQPGEKWRLCLSTGLSESHWVKSIDGYFEMDDPEEAGTRPENHPFGDSWMIIPVSSEGIEITPAGGPSNGTVRAENGQASAKKAKKEEQVKAKQENGSVAKQQRIEREFNWYFDRTSQGSIYVLEQTSFDLDKKLWDAGFALGVWLWKVHWAREENELGYEWPESAMTTVARLQSDVFWGEGCDAFVLELGSGTGFVSLCFARIWEDLRSERRLTVTATDLPSALEIMRNNMEENRFKVKVTDDEGVGNGKVKKEGDQNDHANGADENEDNDEDEDDGELIDMQARVLDWDRPLPSWVGEHQGGDRWPELILASDVTYNTASFPSLVKTLVSLLKPSDRPDRPQLLLAYKERDPAERELWPTLEAEGIKMEKIDVMKGAEDYGFVEIWIGSAAESG